MTPQRWYYARNGQKFGPFSSAQLKNLAAAGKLQPADTLFREGNSQGMAARSVKGLFTAAEPAPAPGPPARRLLWPFVAAGVGGVLVTVLAVLVIKSLGNQGDTDGTPAPPVTQAKTETTPKGKTKPATPVAPLEKQPTGVEPPPRKQPPEPENTGPDNPKQPPGPATDTVAQPGTKPVEEPGALVPAQQLIETADRAATAAGKVLAKATADEQQLPDDLKATTFRIFLQEGLEQIAERRYEDAIVSLQQATKLRPDNKAARLALASAEKALAALNPAAVPKLPPDEPKQPKTTPEPAPKKAVKEQPRSELEQLLDLGSQALAAGELDLAGEILGTAAESAPKEEGLVAALAELAQARRGADPQYVRQNDRYAVGLKAGRASYAAATKMMETAQPVQAAKRFGHAVGFFRDALEAARELERDYAETANLAAPAQEELQTAQKAQQQADFVVRVQGLVKEVYDLTQVRQLKKAIAKFKAVQKLAPEDKGVAAAGQELEQAIKNGPGVTLLVLAGGNPAAPSAKSQLTVRVNRKTGGYRGSISVGLLGLPEGVTVSPSYVMVRAGQSDAQFQLTIGTSVRPGIYPLRAIGRLPDEVVGAEFRLTVPGPKR